MDNMAEGIEARTNRITYSITKRFMNDALKIKKERMEELSDKLNEYVDGVPTQFQERFQRIADEIYSLVEASIKELMASMVGCIDQAVKGYYRDISGKEGSIERCMKVKELLKNILSKKPIYRTLTALMNAGEWMTATELAMKLDRAEPTITEHLRKLVKDGYVEVSEGRRKKYKAVDAPWL